MTISTKASQSKNNLTLYEKTLKLEICITEQEKLFYIFNIFMIEAAS